MTKIKEKISVSAQQFISSIMDSSQETLKTLDDKKANEIYLVYKREDDEPEEEAKLYGEG